MQAGGCEQKDAEQVPIHQPRGPDGRESLLTQSGLEGECRVPGQQVTLEENLEVQQVDGGME